MSLRFLDNWLYFLVKLQVGQKFKYFKAFEIEIKMHSCGNIKRVV